LQNWGHQNSETPEPIATEFDVGDYVSNITLHAKVRSDCPSGGRAAKYHTTTVLQPFFWDDPGELVPEDKLLDFRVQGKINRGRHTDLLAGRHSVWTNQTE